MLLETDAIHVRLPGRPALRFAPSRWDLDGKAGVTVIRGDNGTGKTTFLNVLSGHSRPAKGQMLLDGHRVSGLGPARARRLGVVRAFQLPILCSELTVWQNVAIPRFGSSCLRASGFKARVEEDLAAAGLADAADRAPDELSFGQRRMIELLRVRAQAETDSARLVLLDEPFNGLDNNRRASAAEILMSLLARGVSTIIVEHDELVAGIPQLAEVRFLLGPQGEVSIVNASSPAPSF